MRSLVLSQNAIEAYDITESIIPTREGFKETKAGETVRCSAVGYVATLH